MPLEDLKMWEVNEASSLGVSPEHYAFIKDRVLSRTLDELRMKARGDATKEREDLRKEIETSI